MRNFSNAARRLLLFIALAGMVPNFQAAPAPQLKITTSGTTEPSLERKLLDEYVLSMGKITSDDRESAMNLIISRGQPSGFGYVILEELKRQTHARSGKYPQAGSEHMLVYMLGRMLTIEAMARAESDYRRQHPKAPVPARTTMLRLGPEVVEELLKMATDAPWNAFPNYVKALAGADDARTRDYLKKVMIGTAGGRPGNPPVDQDTMFAAAVGLANLNDRDGVAWLVEHCEDQTGLKIMMRYAHPGAEEPTLGANCVWALQAFSGEADRKTKIQWREWLKGQAMPLQRKQFLLLSSKPW